MTISMMSSNSMSAFCVILKISCLLLVWNEAVAFQPQTVRVTRPHVISFKPVSPFLLNAMEQPPKDEEEKSLVEQDGDAASAATNTINERLMAELEEVKMQEKYGARSSAGKKLGMVDGYGRPQKTEEEREQAIQEARDLNGVNPVVAIVGSVFALGVAAGLWTFTNFLGEWFATHPVLSETYFIQRLASVFRNVVMGLVSLASGFFGVTGFGIFLLGVRVAYGVAKGELDPTPIKKKNTLGLLNDKEELVLPSAWDLMLGKKKKRGDK